MVPRGGGASYTDGYVYRPGGHVLFDTGGLDTITIDIGNGHVTAGAGVTWADLKHRLDPLNVRTPFWGPFSGLAATVGGSISQNTVSHGSAQYGISAESVLSMDVVLATGEILTTSASTATRHFGPDLTGLFTGDCGALGIKAAITLPLIDARSQFEAMSFAFDDFAAYHAAEQRLARARLEDSHFGLSASLSQGQIGKQQGLASRIRIARDIMQSAPNVVAGTKQLLKMAIAGESALSAGAYMSHFIVEGVDALDVGAKVKHIRALMAPYCREIANSVPAFVRAMPFAPLTNMLGPNGERWVPLHGILPHKNVMPFHDALMQFYAVRQTDMDRLGIWHGSMFNPVGPAGFLYEIAVYWPDERSEYHDTMLDAEYLAALPNFAANQQASDYVEMLKRDLIALYDQFDAAHFQIGRAYAYRARLSSAGDTLIAGIKKLVDPKNLMNPGSLGL
jgi:D-lactate dehydrogenase (cytochrome)